MTAGDCIPKQSVQSPNFYFLEQHQPLLVTYAALAERYVFDDPNTALLKLRQFSELLIQWMAATAGIDVSEREDLKAILGKLGASRQIPRDILEQLHSLRKMGNAAMHDHAGDRSGALWHLRTTHKISVWFFRNYYDPRFKGEPFRPPPEPEMATKELAAELVRLREELVSRELAEEEARRLATEERAKRVEAEQRGSEAKSEIGQRLVHEQLLRKTAEQEAARAKARESAQRATDEDARRAYDRLAAALAHSDQRAQERLQELKADFQVEVRRVREEIQARPPMRVEHPVTHDRRGRALPSRRPKPTIARMVLAGGLLVAVVLVPLSILAFSAGSAPQTRDADHRQGPKGQAIEVGEPGTPASPIFEAVDGSALRAQEGKRVRVRGVVKSATLVPSGKVLYLNFGPSRSDCLAAKVFHQNFENWPGGLERIKSAYSGKTIEFEGVIEVFRNRPELAIGSPAEIRIVSD